MVLLPMGLIFIYFYNSYKINLDMYVPTIDIEYTNRDMYVPTIDIDVKTLTCMYQLGT